MREEEEYNLLYENALDALKKKKFSPERVLAELQLKSLLFINKEGELTDDALNKLNSIKNIERPIIKLNELKDSQLRMDFKVKQFDKIYEELMNEGFELSSLITKEELKKQKCLMVNYGIIDFYSHTKAWFPEVFYTESIFTNIRPLNKKY